MRPIHLQITPREVYYYSLVASPVVMCQSQRGYRLNPQYGVEIKAFMGLYATCGSPVVPGSIRSHKQSCHSSMSTAAVEVKGCFFPRLM